MATTIHTFNEYIEEGSKLAQFKEMYGSLEQMGKGFKDIKGTVDNAKNLDFLSTIKDKFSASVTLDEKINSALKNSGLTDNTIGLLNKATKGLISAADPFIMSIYGAAETFASSILEDVVSSIMSKVYIPEEVFLIAIKTLAAAKSDPNDRNILRKACLVHDLAKTLEWLDNHNGTKYDIESSKTQDAMVASKYGAFRVATYILKKLKTSYSEIKATPVLTADDESRKSLLLRRYELFYNSVIKNIFVCSYDNLTVEEFRNIIQQFPTFSPACLGTSDEKYNRRSLINISDINIIAPIKYYRTVKEMVDINEQKAFIVPRNHNIKKLYVWLAFSTDYNDNARLVNEALHNRLKYKILSTMDEAYYEAQKALINSPLGSFISNLRDNYAGLISKYVKEVEQYLFDPKKQDLITGEDHITLPNFRPKIPSATNTDKQKRKELCLPKPQCFTQTGLSYNDFEVYYVDPKFSIEQIAQDSVTIVRNRRLTYMTHYSLISRSPDPTDFKLYNNLYLIFFNEKYNGKISEVDRKNILDYVVCKYIIDYYKSNNYPFETIIAMFPSLNDAGIFYQFIDYYKISSEDEEYIAKNGLGRELKDISFYNQILNTNGDIIKIEETGINIYDVFGEKSKSIYDLPGNAVGLSIIDDDTYILSLNNKNGELEAYFSPDDGISLIKMEGDANEASVYPGVGITSIHQINFYESLYYNDILFILADNKIKYTQDRVNFNELNISFFNETILGIAFLPNNSLYILTNAYVYVIENFDISTYEFNTIKLAENDNNFMLIKGVVGTIITAVSIPINTTDDFDIDDYNIINKLLMYYNSSKLLYYWYSTDSSISLEMFDNNIRRLQELIGNTTNEDRIKVLARCIERQEYFKSKLL